MTIKELDQLDFDRLHNTVGNTDTFTKTLQKINRLCVRMSKKGLAKLLMINPKTLLSWEEAGLIFPMYKSKSTYRHYALKDVLRGLTIKYLMSELGFRKFAGVKLVLSLVNEILKPTNQGRPTIDNIYIDRYLIRVLNYDIEGISQMKLHGNSKRYRDDDSIIEDC